MPPVGDWVWAAVLIAIPVGLIVWWCVAGDAGDDDVV
jgi:hypothetical protein